MELGTLLLITGAGLALLLVAWRRFFSSNMSSLGKVVYVDEPGKASMIRHPTLPIQGRPDGIIKHKGKHVPYEYKSKASPQKPYANHVLQLMGEGLLVEAKYGKYPAYGFIEYGHGSQKRVHRVWLGKKARATAVRVVEAINGGQSRPMTIQKNRRCDGCPARQFNQCVHHGGTV